jgi:hypothetical protein
MTPDLTYLTIPRAALELRVTEGELRKAIADGRLGPLARMGRFFVVTASDLEAARLLFDQPASPGDVGGGVPQVMA